MTSTFSVLVGTLQFLVDSDPVVSMNLADSDSAVSVHKLHFLIFSSLQDTPDRKILTR